MADAANLQKTGSAAQQPELIELQERLREAVSYLHIDELRHEITRLEEVSSDASFWQDAQKASDTVAVLNRLKSQVAAVDAISKLLDEVQTAQDLARELLSEQNEETSREAQSLLHEGADLAREADNKLCSLELSSWFNEEFDHGGAIVTITPGQGGLEAQDWCAMLFKMYLAYCARKNWKVAINDAPAGESIGLDRATFTVTGEDVYGMLRAEEGVHRLVRISPTDAKKRRHTTFAGVEVLPILPDNIEVEIDPSDLRIDVFHASGHGGQGVNTTDSAVRITHLPTGIVVTCQNERSQLQNKAFAMNILRAKLYELEKQKRAQEIDDLRGFKGEIGFGNQIRSYVLYPYQLVKDLRTGYETSQVNDVLQDGNLDPFIISYHRMRTKEGGDHGIKN